MQKSVIYENALENAFASVSIEGFETSEMQNDFCLDFLCGKINKDEFIKTVLERYKISCHIH